MMEMSLTDQDLIIVRPPLVQTFTVAEAEELRQWLNAHGRELYARLRPAKDWTRCPFMAHADDCDCNGMGGDR